MSEERREADPAPSATEGWSARLRAELVAAAQRAADDPAPDRRRLLCRHRRPR